MARGSSCCARAPTKWWRSTLAPAQLSGGSRWGACPRACRSRRTASACTWRTPGAIPSRRSTPRHSRWSARLPAGFEPNAAITDRAGRFLYVANRISNDVSVVDLTAGMEVKRLAAGRGASYLALSPDGASIYCTHIYPYAREVPHAARIRNHGHRHRAAGRRRTAIACHNAAGVFHVALSADGRLGNGGATASQEPDPAGARGARVGLREFARGVRRGRRRSRADPARRIGPLLHAALRRRARAGQEHGLHFDHRLGQRDRDRHREAAGVHPRGDSGASGGRWPTISRPRRITWWRAFRWAAAPKGLALSPDGKRLYVANRTGRHHLGDRYRRAEGKRHAFARRACQRRRRSAAASACSSARASPFRAISAAPTATWNPPSTAFSGTWSRTASARTSWITACSKTSPRRRRSSGTAAIRTWKPSAVRAPRSSSTARKATTAGSCRDLVSYHQIDAAPPQPLPAGERRTDGRTGARQGDLRAHAEQGRHADSASEPMPGVPFRAALHEPETGGRGQRQSRRTGRR